LQVVPFEFVARRFHKAESSAFQGFPPDLHTFEISHDAFIAYIGLYARYYIGRKRTKIKLLRPALQ